MYSFSVVVGAQIEVWQRNLALVVLLVGASTMIKPLGADDVIDSRKALATLEAKYAQQLTRCEFTDALETLEGVARLRADIFGESHWQAIVDRESIKSLNSILTLSDKDRASIAYARGLRLTASEATRNGRFVTAERLIRECVEIHERIAGSKDFGCTVARDAHVRALMRLSRFDDARRLSGVVVSSYKVLGESHPAVAGAMQTHASILIELGRIEEAEPLLKSALEICERHFGVDGFECWPSHAGLALVFSARRDGARAQESIGRALQITLTGSVSRSIDDYALCLVTKAQILRASAQPKEALECCQRALEIRETRKSNAVLIVQSLDEVAATLRGLGRVEEAALHEQRAAELRANPTWEGPKRPVAKHYTGSEEMKRK